MKKDHLRHFICLFFLVLFSFKGIISIFPALSAKAAKRVSLQISTESEPIESKKNAEETNEKEIKEFLLKSIAYYNIGNSAHIVTNTNIKSNNIDRKQDVFLPVITPPPEQV
jgi:hypothetical protein